MVNWLWPVAALAICTGAVAAGDPVNDGGSRQGGAPASPFLSLSELKLLERVRELHPWQTLGEVRVNGRAYLVGSSPFPPPAGAAIAARDPGKPTERLITLVPGVAGEHGLVRSDRGAVILAAGRTVYLVDPVTPEIVVELKAGSDRPLVLNEILELGSRPGIFAGLSAPGTSADAALQGPEGRIFFIVTAKPPAVEKSAPVRATEPEPIPPVARAVEPRSEPAAPVMQAVEDLERRPPPAAVPSVAGSPTVSAEKDSYASALRTLHERQGRAWLRAVGQPQLTQAVDHALHALGFAR